MNKQLQHIHIYLESNPNPNSLKFVVNEMLIPEGMSFDFPDPQSAEHAPLAKELFQYPFVERVFYMSNFITITKREDVEWIEIQDTLRQHIKKFLESGRLIIEPVDETVHNEDSESESVKKIKSILDEYIRPAVEQDGGAITYHSFSDGVLKVRLQGSCSGCPSSMITLKAGIENLFTRLMPGEVRAVEAL